MTTSDWWQAECARLRVELEATERARREAEDERDAALELVAPDAVAVARQRDDRDAAVTATAARDRIEHRAVVAAVATRLHQHRALDAQEVVQPAEALERDLGRGEAARG